MAKGGKKNNQATASKSLSAPLPAARPDGDKQANSPAAALSLQALISDTLASAASSLLQSSSQAGLSLSARAVSAERIAEIVEAEMAAAGLTFSTAFSQLPGLEGLSEEEARLRFQRQLEAEIPPRLAQLQRQLEHLEPPAANAAAVAAAAAASKRKRPPPAPMAMSNEQRQQGDELVEAVARTASQTEQSLQALRRRLGEVKQQLYGAGNSSYYAEAVADALASVGFEEVEAEVVGQQQLQLQQQAQAQAHAHAQTRLVDLDGEDFREDSSSLMSRLALHPDYQRLMSHYLMTDEDEDLDDDDLEDELVEVIAAEGEDANYRRRLPHLAALRQPDDLDDDDDDEDAVEDGLLRASRLGRHPGGFLPPPSSASMAPSGGKKAGGGSEAETELESALAILTSPHLTAEAKLSMIRERFAEVIRQDLYWRHRAQLAGRQAQEARLERQLVEMELDKAHQIKCKLDALCRDLQQENQRLKEATERELDELVKGGVGVSKAAAAAVKGGKAKKNGGKEEPASSSLSSSSSSPPSFSLPPLPSNESNAPALLASLRQAHQAWNAREEHYKATLRTQQLAVAAAQAKSQSTSRSDCPAHERRIASLSRSEAELKAQVRQYVEKFRQVEETLAKSNELFTTFRSEMEQMGSKVSRLERENGQLHGKCGTLSRNIIEMADERAKQAQSMEILKAQKAKLEQLCRTLQAERNSALARLKAIEEVEEEEEEQQQQQEPEGRGVPVETIPPAAAEDA